MATAKCNISFRINYTSSVPINSGILYYRTKDTTGSYTEFGIISVPSSGGLININGFQGSGEYDFIVKLITDKGTVEKEGSFTVGVCTPPVCEIPSIKRVYWGTEDQLLMEYSVSTDNLKTPEYQIATDPDFKDIIYFKVGFDYNPTEPINIPDKSIADGTTLYIRARKHCDSYGISDWSNVIDFKWVNLIKASYNFKDAYCISGSIKSPGDTNICWMERNPLAKTINLVTPFPKAGSYIYLSDGVTRAIPGNLKDFDTDGGPDTGFDAKGIKWIRFGSYNPYRIYDVEPLTGVIIGVSEYYNCYS